MKALIKQNSSLILAGGAGVGVIVTGYLAARGGMQAARSLENEDPYMSNKDKARLVWRFYIPAGAAGAGTILCIVGSKRVDSHKTMAAQAALAVAQRAYSEYRGAVVEELGEKKDQLLAAKAVESRSHEFPIPQSVIVAEGKVLCYEAFTGRYFESSMQDLIEAKNQINGALLSHDYATLDDLYYILGLEYTKSSNHSGWKSPRLLELEFSTIMTKDGRPCLAFDYNYVVSF